MKTKQVLAQKLQLNSAEMRTHELHQHVDALLRANDSHNESIEALDVEIDALLDLAGIDVEKFNLGDEDELITAAEEERIRNSIKKFDDLQSVHFENAEQYQMAIDAYLKESGYSLNEDPIFEIFSSQELKTSLAEYEKKYGKLKWNRSDYMMVGLVSIFAILIDYFLISIPADMRFKGVDYKGSPITKALKEKTTEWYSNKDSGIGKLLRELEDWAKVPYDISVNNKEKGVDIKGLRPALHRLMEPGHDPIVGFVVGVVDILRGTCTIIDQYGQLHVLQNGDITYNLFEAFLKVFAHLLSDVFTKTGLPCPFMSLLQLCTGKSPFALRENGEKVSFTDVARFLYANGYDMRHFATMGIEPLFIEVCIRTYYNFCYFDSLLDHDKDVRHKVKKSSLLTATHSFASCGNIIKMWTIGWNPLAFNYAEFIGLGLSIIRTIKANGDYNDMVTAEINAIWGEALNNS